MFFLLISPPNFPSPFIPHANITACVNTVVHRQMKFFPILIHRLLCAHLYSTFSWTCTYLHTCESYRWVPLSVPEVPKGISHILFTGQSQGVTWWQALNQCSLNKGEDLVKKPKDSGQPFSSWKRVGQSLSRHFLKPG